MLHVPLCLEGPAERCEIARACIVSRE
jgi:hypothetical protein